VSLSQPEPKPNPLLEELETLQKISTGSTPSANVLTKSISDSLNKITKSIKPWGRLLKGSSTPDIASVEDIAVWMDDLDNELIDLLFWLEEQDSCNYWSTLEREIQKIRVNFGGANIRASFYSYIEFRKAIKENSLEMITETVEKTNVNESYNERRILVGTQIINFANALSRAVREADLADCPVTLSEAKDLPHQHGADDSLRSA
jgi:hypothetical protein